MCISLLRSVESLSVGFEPVVGGLRTHGGLD
jgi:hypothetical protein